MFARDSGKTKVKLGSDLTLNESYYINFVQLLHFLTQKAGKRHFTFYDWLVFFWHSLINSCEVFFTWQYKYLEQFGFQSKHFTVLRNWS